MSEPEHLAAFRGMNGYKLTLAEGDDLAGDDLNNRWPGQAIATVRAGNDVFIVVGPDGKKVLAETLSIAVPERQPVLMYDPSIREEWFTIEHSPNDQLAAKAGEG